MDPDPSHLLYIPYLQIFLLSFFSIGIALLCLVLMLFCSALVSGSEVAFFSLSPKDKEVIDKDEHKNDAVVKELRQKPRTLLATILIVNNFINIGIVILSDFIIRSLLGEDKIISIGKWLSHYLPGEPIFLGGIVNFLLTIVGVTFLLVLFGEIAPKIYANINNLSVARFMSKPMSILSTIFRPFSSLLVSWSTRMESSFISTRTGLNDDSKAELDKAIQLAVEGEEESEEADILRGIIKFGNVSAKQVMKSRVDVVALEESVGFKEVMDTIKTSGYSRIPVIKEDFDEVVGMLYAKDLLGYSKENNEFNWQQFIREKVLYVPESKKIDDILKEFQSKHLHMAIVVDEFGGSNGIVTLEDIVEEVIGEIKDEFDEEEEVDFIKINDSNYIFEGKTLLHDVARILNLEKDSFDNYKEESDSLAGLMLGHIGHIPKKDKEISVGHFKFKIVAVSKRRIEKIHVTLL